MASVLSRPDGGDPVGPLDSRTWVLPVLASVAVPAVLVALVVGWQATGVRIVFSLLNVALLAALLLPVAAVALRFSAAGGRGVHATLLVFGFLLLSAVGTGLPRVPPFSSMRWNWQGKLIDLLWVGVLFVVLWRWARTRAGLRGRLEPGSWWPALIAVAGLAGLWFGLTVLAAWAGAPPGDTSVERLLFDSTFPNLTEELIWRGAMLAVLDQAFGTPWRLAGAHVGWGFVLTSVLFGLGHGLVVNPEAGFRFLPVELVLTTFAGLVLGWVRARTGSLWPAYVAHCAPELAVRAAITMTA